MALAITLLTSDPDTGNAASYTTPSLTPAGSAGVVVCVYSSDASDAVKGALDVPTWLDGAWTEELDLQVTGAVSRMTVWSGKAIASPAGDTLNWNTGADNQTGAIIDVVQVTGQDVTDFVLQPEIAQVASGTSASATLNGALAGATSAHLCFVGRQIVAASAPTGGETELDDGTTGTHGTPNRSLTAQYEVNDTTSGCSWSGNAVGAIALLEIKAGPTEHTGAAALATTAGRAAAGVAERFAAAALALAASRSAYAVAGAGARGQALTPSVLATVASTTNATSYTTAPFTPEADAGVVVCVYHTRFAADPLKGALDAPTWLSGGWAEEADAPGITFEGDRMTVWSGRTTSSPGSDDLTASWASTQDGCFVVVLQVTKEDTADFVLQPKTYVSSSGAGQLTVALDSALRHSNTSAVDRKSTRLNSSHPYVSRMPSSA